MCQKTDPSAFCKTIHVQFVFQILPIQRIMRTITTVVLENCLISRMNVIEVSDCVESFQILSTHIHDHFQELPFYKVCIVLEVMCK